MLGANPSLLIGSQLRALLLNQCVGNAFRGRLRVGIQCVDRSDAAWGRAAAVRDIVRLVSDERLRRRGRVKACAEEGERWLGGAPRRQRQKF